MSFFQKLFNNPPSPAPQTPKTAEVGVETQPVSAEPVGGIEVANPVVADVAVVPTESPAMPIEAPTPEPTPLSAEDKEKAQAILDTFKNPQEHIIEAEIVSDNKDRAIKEKLLSFDKNTLINLILGLMGAVDKGYKEAGVKGFLKEELNALGKTALMTGAVVLLKRVVFTYGLRGLLGVGSLGLLAYELAKFYLKDKSTSSAQQERETASQILKRRQEKRDKDKQNGEEKS